jgi:flagellar hook-length control protein FliK
MNIRSLSVIDLMFAGLAAADPRRSKPARMNKASQLYPASTDGPYLSDVGNRRKTYNSAIVEAEKLVRQSLEGPECMPRKKTAAGPHADGTRVVSCPRTPPQGPAKAERKSQHQARAAVSGTGPAEATSAEKSPTVTAVPGTSTPATSRTPTPATSRTPTPATSRTPYQQQRAAKTPYKPVQLANNQGLVGHERALPDDDKELIVARKQQEGVKNKDKVVVSDSKAVATEGFVSKKSGTKSTLKEAASSKATTSDERLPVAATKIVGISQKTHPLDNRFPQDHEKAPDTDQKASIGPEKSTLSPVEAKDSKLVAGQIPSVPIYGKREADNPSAKPFPGVLNVAELRLSSGQTKDRSSTPDKGSSRDSTDELSSGNTQMPVSKLQSAAAQATKTPNNASPTDVFDSAREQVMQSMRGSLQQDDKCITIRLHPPELGKVVIRFQQHEDQITGFLEASKAQTRDEIEQALPQIIQTLRDSGVQINRLEVLLADQSGRQADTNHLLQDGSFQQHYSAEGDDRGNKSTHEWLTSMYNGSYEDNPDAQVGISDNYINVWV